MFCLLGPGLVCYYWFQFQRKQIRREVKHQIIAGIDRSELVLLKFTNQQAEQLNWKHSKEFEFEHHMYDIVEKTQQGDTAYYWCWPDHEETKLNKKLHKLLAHALRGNQRRRRDQELFASYFKSIFHSNSTPPKFHLFNDFASYSNMEANMHSRLASPPPSPPPEFS